MDSATPPVIFFETTYRYRRPMILAFGLLFTAAGSYVLGVTMMDLLHRRLSLKPGVGSVVGPVWIILILGGGFWCLWMFAVDFRTASRVDSNGITRGRSFHNWDVIAWIGGVRVKTLNRRGITLAFQLRSRWPMAAVRHVVMDPLSDEQYDRVIDQIEQFLVVNHGGVAVG